MPRLSLNPIARVSFGLVGLMISVILLATFLGVFPDRQAEEVQKRSLLCESVAMNFSSMAHQTDFSTLEQHFNAVRNRNQDILSIGLRRADGVPLLETGQHFAE